MPEISATMVKQLREKSRSLSEGTIQSYIHMGGKLGALVEVGCETDFVAKNEDFVAFAKDLAMHVAAANPAGIVPEDVPSEIVEKERDIYKSQALEMGKPENMVEKIAEGKLNKFFKENCLMQQPLSIKRFVRFQVGE